MEFDEEKQYLSYDEYLDLGGQLDETPFDLLEYEARRKIDARTQNRLRDMSNEEIPQEVKMCVYNMINLMMTYTESLSNVNKGIASENIDGYSVNYINTSQLSQILKAKSQDLDDCVEEYLTGVIVNNEHLLYLGVK
jgi:hypothetical protein